MSHCRAELSLQVRLARVLVMSGILLLSLLALAQEEPAPKIEIFTGYQWLNTGETIPTAPPNPSSPGSTKLQDMTSGLGASFTFNFNRHLGLEGDYGENWNGAATATTASVGPRLTWRTSGTNLFLHTLLGVNRLAPNGLTASNGIGAILGGGIDMPLWRPLTLRLFEADYVWARHNFADAAGLAFPDLRRPSQQGVRFRTGLVWNVGYPSPASLGANCSVQPSAVMVGEPVTATATGSNFNPKHRLAYSWSSTGGKITGKDNTASIDTNGVAGGSYTVTAHIADPRMKGGEASCTANFSVKEPPKNPPAVSCSANPATVQTGASSTISCTCTSPDGVPVTVSGWTASGGSVSGSGSTATLNTTGASPGPVTVTATCSDTRGLNTSVSAQVTVEAPPPPQVNPLETRLALHSIYFPTAQPTVQKPNGGLLASQQTILTAIAGDFVKYLEIKPDAHLILEGHADPRGSIPYNQALSERRVARTKSFLTERGVPAANIETKAFGHQRNLTAAEVKDSVEKNPELTTEERKRVLKNIRVIVLASNRRVDITLSTTGQQSVRQYPFNAADSLSLIGGREAEAKKAAGAGARKKTKKK